MGRTKKELNRQSVLNALRRLFTRAQNSHTVTKLSVRGSSTDEPTEYIDLLTDRLQDSVMLRVEESSRHVPFARRKRALLDILRQHEAQLVKTYG